MVDRSRTGYRCCTRYFLRTVKGDLPRHSAGTVVSETENLGRHLILVNWDSGVTVPVFPDEIEFVDDPSFVASS
ncbi:MAG: hypothetical protein AB7G75_25115 [Candidatus Binatia bacterium]